MSHRLRLASSQSSCRVLSLPYQSCPEPASLTTSRSKVTVTEPSTGSWPLLTFLADTSTLWSSVQSGGRESNKVFRSQCLVQEPRSTTFCCIFDRVSWWEAGSQAEKHKFFLLFSNHIVDITGRGDSCPKTTYSPAKVACLRFQIQMYSSKTLRTISICYFSELVLPNNCWA